MIKLTRDRTVVYGGFRGQYLRKKIKRLFERKREQLANPNLKIEFKSHWKKTKPQLELEANSKCAYCEAHTKVVAHGDVEHYRPKSIYWWLAYTYDNYLFSCQICNQTYKGANFPVEGNTLTEPVVLSGLTDDNFAALIEKYVIDPKSLDADESIVGLKKLSETETALLLNPYLDSPEKWLAYDYDDNKKTVAIIPIENNPKSEKFVSAAENFLGINREELLEKRYETFRVFRSFKRTLGKLKDDAELLSETEEIIQIMQQQVSVFSGMCKYFNKKRLDELKNTPPSIEN